MAVLSSRKFRVFDSDPVSLICAGDFGRAGDTFQYSLKDETLEFQFPTPEIFKVSEFTASALSTRYLVIGAPGRVMAFIVEGSLAGRWVISYKYPKDPNALIEKLTFSGDEKELLALLRAEMDGSSQTVALMFSTDKRELPTEPSPQEIIFEKWGSYRPTGVSFSTGGIMVAICTTPSDYLAGIQLLKKEETGNWILGELQNFPVFRETERREWTGHGFTGISLYI